MTTTVTNPEIETTYEPTVADKIQRILYRLDHGEKLVCGALRDGDNFCVLGMFADESGLGEWSRETDRAYRDRYLVGEGPDNISTVWLSDVLADYYNLRTGGATFEIGKLPGDIQQKLNAYNVKPHTCDVNLISLDLINDLLLSNNDVSNPEANEILAAIIRTGVIFKDSDEDTALDLRMPTELQI